MQELLDAPESQGSHRTKKKKKKRKLGAQENKITNIYDLVKFDPDPLWGPSSNLSAHVGSPVHPPPA